MNIDAGSTMFVGGGDVNRGEMYNLKVVLNSTGQVYFSGLNEVYLAKPPHPRLKMKMQSCAICTVWM